MILLLFLAAVSDPVPLKPLTQLLSEGDKLSVVERVGAQGTVGVKVTVDAAGRVSDCAVSHSSGFKALDAETCKVVQRKARFAPAKDERGRPVQGILYGEIAWEPETEKP